MTKAERVESTFKLEYAVTRTVRASPDRVWELITDAANIPKWTSTVTHIEGNIALGQKLELRVPLAPNRKFTPKVTRFEPSSLMEWSDGMAPMFRGVRTYALTPQPDGTTEFSMREVFTGLMLPMIKGSLPDFREAFDAYADDLKRAAE